MKSLYKAAIATVFVAGVGGYAAGAILDDPADLPDVGDPVVMTPAGQTTDPSDDPGHPGDDQQADDDQQGGRPGDQGDDDWADGRPGGSGDVQNGAQGTGGRDPAPEPAPQPAPAPDDEEIGIGIDDDEGDDDGDDDDDDDDGGDD